MAFGAEEDKPTPGSGNVKEDLLKEVDNKITPLLSKFESLQSTLESFMTNGLDKTYKPPKEDPIPEEDSEEWWDTFRSNPKNKLNETVAPLIHSVKSELKEELKKEETIKAERTQFDALAVKQFPQLANPEHTLYKEVEKVMAEKRQRDKDWDKKPEAIYDSAQIAFARLVSRGDIVPDRFIEETRRMVSVNDSSLLPLGGQGSGAPERLTKSQTLWAERLGVAVDKYKKQLR